MIIPINTDQIIYGFSDDTQGNPRIVSMRVDKVHLINPGWYATCSYVSPKTGEMKPAIINDQLWENDYFPTAEEAIWAAISELQDHINRLNKSKDEMSLRLLWLYGLQTAASEHLLSFPNIL